MAKAGSTLSDKQRVFVAEYAKDFNATAAYIRAGYSKTGAAQSACKLLTNPKISAAVNATVKNIEKAAVVTQARVLDGLLEEATNKNEGTPASRVAAWSWLGKHMKLFTDKIEHLGAISVSFNANIKRDG